MKKDGENSHWLSIPIYGEVLAACTERIVQLFLVLAQAEKLISLINSYSTLAMYISFALPLIYIFKLRVTLQDKIEQ